MSARVGESVSDPFAITEEAFDVSDTLLALNLPSEIEKIHVERARLKNAVNDTQASASNKLRRFATELLQVVDGLDRIIEYTASSDEDSTAIVARLQRNVVSTRRSLLQKLATLHIHPVDLLNREVDESIADVEDVEVNPSLANETVVQEVLKGYTITGNDGVVPLRRAKVVISKTE